MNRAKWQGQDYPDELFAAKLDEERGEVGECHVDLLEDVEEFGIGSLRAQEARYDMIEELSHVEFIARCWREKIEREVANGS